jgi:hypothetical protein
MGDKSYVIAVAIERLARKFSFFGAKVSISQLDNYLRNRFDLRYILSNPDRHKWFEFDLPSSGEFLDMSIFDFDDKADQDLLPEHGTFASDHSEKFSLSLNPNDFTQRYLVDGKWDVREFSKFHGQLSDLYALTKSVTAFEDPNVDLGQKRAMVESFMKPWQGGGSYLSFFKSIADQGGRDHRPELEAIQWASPGYIDVLGNRSSFQRISELIEHFDKNRRSITLCYDELWEYLSEMKLLKLNRKRFDRKSDIALEVNELAKSFSRKLGLAPYRTVKKMAGNDPLVAAKVLLAATRRLVRMHKFFLEGRVAVESAQIG